MEEKEESKELSELQAYMQSVIGQLETNKKHPAVHTYTYTLKSFLVFCEETGIGGIVPVAEVFTPGRLKEYEEWLVHRELSLNTISTYMRTLKAVYNRLVAEKTLAYDPKLFDAVYTKVESQTKRALTEPQIGTLLQAPLNKLPRKRQSALAYFLLMFLLRGMPFIDFCHLRKQDVKGNYLVYSRHKTGRQLTVRIPAEAVRLMEMFRNKNPDSIYLFPVLDGQPAKDGRMKRGRELYDCYRQALRCFNKDLVKVSALLLSGVKMSSYTPRHTWATLAFYRGVHVGIISKALGHSSIKVTETYLKPFENERVDAANNELIVSIVDNGENKEVA